MVCLASLCHQESVVETLFGTYDIRLIGGNKKTTINTYGLLFAIPIFCEVGVHKNKVFSVFN